MERLTFDGNFCDISQCTEVQGGSFCENGSCSQRKVWERLKSFEDTEEQGRLVWLPCRIGDTVYSHISWSGDYERVKDKPYPHRIVFIGINGSKDFSILSTLAQRECLALNLMILEKPYFSPAKRQKRHWRCRVDELPRMWEVFFH